MGPTLYLYYNMGNKMYGEAFIEWLGLAISTIE